MLMSIFAGLIPLDLSAQPKLGKGPLGHQEGGQGLSHKKTLKRSPYPHKVKDDTVSPFIGSSGHKRPIKNNKDATKMERMR